MNSTARAGSSIILALASLGFPFLMAATPVSSYPAELCIDAAKVAAKRTGVPFDVLHAVALVETGQRRNGLFRPWPWAINSAGESHSFDSLAEAEGHVRTALAAGATNVDLGCFQLNYRWHAENFSSLSEMLDPETNATYAAGYLLRLQRQHGDWSSAAAAYHSSTPEHADRYRTKFEATYAAVSGRAIDPAEADPAQREGRENSFPFLTAGGNGDFGSIVPRIDGMTPLFGVP